MTEDQRRNLKNRKAPSRHASPGRTPGVFPRGAIGRLLPARRGRVRVRLRRGELSLPLLHVTMPLREFLPRGAMEILPDIQEEGIHHPECEAHHCHCHDRGRPRTWRRKD